MNLSFYISKVFAQSPIGILKNHMKKVLKCSKILIPLYEESLNNNWIRVKKYLKTIKILEKKADFLISNLKNKLSSNLFLSISKNKILILILLQDKIANKSKDIAGLISGRKIKIPKIFSKDFYYLLEKNILSIIYVYKAISKLKKLVENGISRNKIINIQMILSLLDNIECETDNMKMKINNNLFKIEKNLNPIKVIFLYKLIEWINKLSDYSQEVGGQIQILLVK